MCKALYKAGSIREEQASDAQESDARGPRLVMMQATGDHGDLECCLMSALRGCSLSLAIHPCNTVGKPSAIASSESRRLLQSLADELSPTPKHLQRAAAAVAASGRSLTIRDQEGRKSDVRFRRLC